MINKERGNMWIIPLIVLAVIFLIWWSMKGDTETTPNEVIVPVEDTSVGSVNADAPVTLAYEEALVKYADARIQIEDNCQASPDKGTFKNGTNIMIDNRSGVDRTIKVGSTFPVKAYGFKIVKLSSSNLPATWYVDCDQSQNVATILIQK